MHIKLWIATFLVTNFKFINAQQSTTEKITDTPSEDFIDHGEDGSYRFGYKNGDAGAHYHSSSASADNTVSGRFGYRDSSSKRLVQTTYTAGSRGFRARGPNIARKMSLSQVRIPYRPSVSLDSPDYQPTYDSYFDPNEDPSYEFNFKTPTYSRGEKSDSKGTVNGAYSYIDDVGKRHDVQYEAGSKTGFNVKSPFPDSDHFPGIFYRGPNKPGTPPRGHSAIVRGNDGAYGFVASGPDQRRTEVSDASGHVRGSYTYIDDKGVQRTVQYIAGPNIGYKVIRKGADPIYSSVFPYVRPEFLASTLSDDNIPNIENHQKTSTTELTPLDLNNFENPEDSLNGIFSKSDFGNKRLDDDLFARDTPNIRQDTTSPDSLDNQTPTRSSVYQSNNVQKDKNGLLPPGSTYLPPYPGEKSHSHSPGTHTYSKEPLPIFPEQSPASRTTPGYSENSIYNDGINGPFSSHQGSSHGGSIQHKEGDSEGYKYPNPKEQQFSDGAVHSNIRHSDHINDSHYDGSNKNFYDISSGSFVRAHVQSLDILPYGSKVPSPEEAFQEQIKNRDQHY